VVSRRLFWFSASDCARRDDFYSRLDVISVTKILGISRQIQSGLSYMKHCLNCVFESNQFYEKELRHGGGIVITVPQHPWLWSQQDEYACHVRRYRIAELREKVSKAGFTVIFETSFVSLLLPAMLVSRLSQLKSPSNDDQMSELHLPSFINRVFEGVMNIERQLIRLGVRFPVGGSRLLIAKKLEICE
jgi:hypothetical protein